MSQAMLAAKRVTMRHESADYDAVRDLTLTVERAEIVVLCGRNGSGKSTLLSGLAGILPAREGEVLLQGEPIRVLPRRVIAKQMAFLPQHPAFPEGVEVGELVQWGCHVHRGEARANRLAVSEALRAMDLEALRRRPLERISGGERRRAFVAMVLAQRTPLVLLDEPTAALDVRHALELLELLLDVRKQRGVTFVLALHDLEQAAAVADRLVLLIRGRLYDQGPPETVLEPERIQDVFGIHANVQHAEGRLRVQTRGIADAVRSM